MKVVVNTGPLVFLSKINRLALLQSFGKIIIPKTVLSEIKYKKDDVSVEVSEATGDWLTTKTAKDKNLLKILTNELDGGEAEVICLALEEKAAWVVLDDQDARRYAHRYGLNVIGTLGLPAWAKRKGMIKSFKSEVEGLQKAGFYATAELVEKLLREVGEGEKKHG
jgi:predicted nucleic acid-binding protein